jgi:hypothetical protein
VKEKLGPDQTAITVQTEDAVRYEDLVHVIDECIGDGFPSVSVAPVSNLTMAIETQGKRFGKRSEVEGLRARPRRAQVDQRRSPDHAAGRHVRDHRALPDRQLLGDG